MTPSEIGYIGMAVLFVLLFTGIHIGVVMAVVGFLGITLISGWEAGLGVLKTVPFSTFASYTLSVIPMFLLMGAFSFYSGISKDLYNMAYKWLGRLPGGLAMATIVACSAFSAVSGSSIACAATFTKVSLPEMKRYNYDPALATGSIAAGGTLSIMIPPSVMMIIYAIITEQSIGKLFLAGFIPGAFETLFYMATVFFLCRRNPSIGPRGPSTTLKEKIASLKGIWVSMVIFLVVIGGLYLGVFSPTEAGGIGASAALIFALAQRRLDWQGFTDSLFDTMKTSAMIFIIILGAMIFNYFLAVTRLPFEIASFIGGLPVSRYFILAIILFLYIILGALMDELAMVLLTVPVFFPVMTQLGFDPIWFGVIIMMMCVLGMIAPPVGMIVFVIAGIVPDIPMTTVYRGVLPFFLAATILVVLLVAFPQIVLFLPNMMK
ncbi:MAG: TRAP transporter large permease [Deltaproteobacteria bacterium]|nr:TRAP transporter large permease [Deltaproteobacteria bacterium]